MGTKSYAASVTRILDPKQELFCDRIISRDECFDPRSKALRLKLVMGECGEGREGREGGRKGGREGREEGEGGREGGRGGGT